MAVEFRLPELGEGIDEAEVVSVLVKEGDAVTKDQVVAEVDSDKATVEVPSPADGVITQLAVKAGDTIRPGQLILVIDEGGLAARPEAGAEAPAKDTARAEAPPAPPRPVEAAPAVEPRSPAPQPAAPQEAGAPQSTGVADPSPDGRAPEPVAAAPSVRQFAREIGVDIHDVSGSGPGGRISVDDVKGYAREARPANGGRRAAQPLPDFARWGPVEKEPMSRVRRLTATNLTGAWEAPHVTHHDKADVTEIEAFRQRYKPQVEKAGGRLTLMPILIKLVTAGLKANPKLNASIDMAAQEIVLKKYYNIGIATDTPRGLLVPSIKDADRLSITGIAVELSAMAERARAGKLAPDELQGGSFTISNLGGLRTGFFTPVINPPEVAILGVGRIETEPVYRNGSFEPRQLLMLSLSYDHRLVDGADAARFLSWLVDALRDPLYVMLEG